MTTARYAADDDVRTALGKYGQRLPTDLDLAGVGAMAHAELLDALAAVYPNGLPTFADDALEVVRWAEAKLAAAEVLSLLRVNYADLGDAPELMRSDALGRVRDGVIGYPPGSTSSDGGTGAPVAVSPGPRLTSFTPASAFPDPYDELRDAGIRYL